jgi:hypothetical protein
VKTKTGGRSAARCLCRVVHVRFSASARS